MFTINVSSEKRSIARRSNVQNRRDVSVSIFVSTKATRANLCSDWSNAATTFCTFRRRMESDRNPSIAVARRDVGKSNEPIRGSTAHGAC